MGMPINTNTCPSRLSYVTMKLASLGLTSKHKRKVVTDNKKDWEKWIEMNRYGTNTAGKAPRSTDLEKIN